MMFYFYDMNVGKCYTKKRWGSGSLSAGLLTGGIYERKNGGIKK